MMADSRSYETHEEWLHWFSQSHPKDSFITAYRLAQQFSASQTPIAAANLISQGFEIANELQALQCDEHTLAAAIIYPTVRSNALSLQDLSNKMDFEIAALLLGTKRMEIIDTLSIDHSEFNLQRNLIDNLRKMLLAMVDDIRIVLIKLAERFITLKHLQKQSDPDHIIVAKKIMALYAPLANRLGIGQLKWRMEDMAFYSLNRLEHQNISHRIYQRHQDRHHSIELAIAALKKLLSVEDKKISVMGRAKHIYSIYRKIQQKHLTLEQIYDASAIRILVPTVADCYAVLSTVHSEWEYLPSEFDDYIAKPKPNGYQSIHTVIIGADEQPLEIQIRTHDMHHEAELGVAAHWKYKEGKKSASAYEEKISWLRNVMHWQKEWRVATATRDSLFKKMFDDRIYVFTPKGDALDLKAGATPLDFAYHIHTELGHRCRGAKVNGAIVSLTHTLRTGDCVEILTVKQGSPSRDWMNPSLGYIKTLQARTKIRRWFYQQNYDEHLANGVALFEKALLKNNIPKPLPLGLAMQFNLKSLNDLYAAIGAGDIGVQTVINKLKVAQSPLEKIPQTLVSPVITPVQIAGIKNLLMQLAQCCRPIPGDPIIGYITKDRGITIHHENCVNIKQAIKFRLHRIIAMDWSSTTSQKYPVSLLIEAHDRAGLLRDVSSIIANDNIPILSLNTKMDALHRYAYLQVTIEISSLTQLEKIIRDIKALPEVVIVKRQRYS